MSVWGSQRPGLVGETRASVTKALLHGDLTQMDTAEGRDSHPPPNSLSTQLYSPEVPAAPGPPPAPHQRPREQPARPAPNNRPRAGSTSLLIYFRSTQSGSPWGGTDSHFSPGLTKLLRPCDWPSRQQREKFPRISGPLMGKVCLINN